MLVPPSKSDQNNVPDPGLGTATARKSDLLLNNCRFHKWMSRVLTSRFHKWLMPLSNHFYKRVSNPRRRLGISPPRASNATASVNLPTSTRLYNLCRQVLDRRVRSESLCSLPSALPLHIVLCPSLHTQLASLLSNHSHAVGGC